MCLSKRNNLKTWKLYTHAIMRINNNKVKECLFSEGVLGRLVMVRWDIGLGGLFRSVAPAVLPLLKNG